MKKFLPALSALLLSCGSGEQKEQPRSVLLDTAFGQYENYFLEEFWKMYPGRASGAGYHKYDSILVVPDWDFHRREVEFCRLHLDSLKKYSPYTHSENVLSASNQTDYFILENILNSIIWHVETFREFEWNPAYYNVGGTFAEILQSGHAPVEEKMKMLFLRMKNIPAYYENARQIIKNPTAEHTDLAIRQNKGSVEVFSKMFRDSLEQCALSAEEKKEIEQGISRSVKAIEGYVQWLEKIKAISFKEGKQKGFRSFRIGKKLYEKKFEYDIQSRFSAEEIYRIALQRKKELHAEMYSITAGLWNQYMGKKPVPADSLEAIRLLIEKISLKHVHRDSFQTAIEKQIPELIRFVNEKNLLELDSSKPLVVRKEPAYMSGVAGASVNSPGPYDKEGKTYYNVSSLVHYSAEQAESYLREYNHYILQILNIHEAIPGHYTQLVYSNLSPSLIKSLFGNGAMIEGWAVYAERMMLESGYGNNVPEMKLMYDKWHLRTVCNTILDYSVHVLNMSKEEAVKLLTREAFQQQQEAENKWRRVSVTQVQLASYFTGFTEIFELREEMKKRKDKQFDLKKFHEEFLSFGSTPVQHIRKLMLKNNEPEVK